MTGTKPSSKNPYPTAETEPQEIPQIRYRRGDAIPVQVVKEPEIYNPGPIWVPIKRRPRADYVDVRGLYPDNPKRFRRTVKAVFGSLKDHPLESGETILAWLAIGLVSVTVLLWLLMGRFPFSLNAGYSNTGNKTSQNSIWIPKK